MLLIVPYGIETHIYGFTFFIDKLLIVPYGIETLSDGQSDERLFNF